MLAGNGSIALRRERRLHGTAGSTENPPSGVEERRRHRRHQNPATTVFQNCVPAIAEPRNSIAGICTPQPRELSQKAGPPPAEPGAPAVDVSISPRPQATAPDQPRAPIILKGQPRETLNPVRSGANPAALLQPGAESPARRHVPPHGATIENLRLPELAQFSMNPILESVRVSDSQEKYSMHGAALVFLN